MRYILRVVDFETTGVPDENDQHSVVDIGLVDVCAENKHKLGAYSSLVKPTTPMSIKAQSIHHISHSKATQEGVDWNDAVDMMNSSAEDTTIIYVAHNADFEKNFFNPNNAIWIDTYKVALRLYPDAPSHSNQVLKYFLDIKDDEYLHHPPHRALPDCHVTAEILLKMSENMTFNDMVKTSKQPPYLTVMPFGKHKGERFEDLPRDYCQWLSRQQDLSEGVKFALQRLGN